MRNIVISLLCGAIVLFPPQVSALTGVASKVNQVSSGQLVNTTIRHSPESEVIIVDSLGEVVVATLDEGDGVHQFSFRVNPSQINDLSVLAVDPASQTRAIPFNPNLQSAILLPPSLAENPAVSLTQKRVGIGGYSFPGASITINLVSEDNQTQTTVETADVEGAWLAEFVNLENGTYTVTATARFNTLTSQASVPLTIEVAPDSVVNALPKPVSQAAENVGNVVGNVVDTVVPKPISNAVKDVAPQAAQVADTVTPVASAGLLTQLLFASRDLFYFFFQAVGGALQYFGFWRKRNSWGVVYDSFTKQPINLATVRLYALPMVAGSIKRLVETDVTSNEGIFSFESEPGDYELQVTKPGYEFPSHLVAGRIDGEYTHVYHGERVHLDQAKSFIDVAVPLDPADVTHLSWRFKLIRFFRQRLHLFTQAMLLIGFVMSLVSVIGGDSGFSAFILLFYTAILGAQWYIYYRKRKSWGKVTDRKGNLLSGVQLNLVDPQFNKLVQRRVTNEQGKYQFLVPAGKYVIQVENVEYSIYKGNKKAYQGQEIWVEGDKPKLMAFHIILEASEK